MPIWPAATLAFCFWMALMMSLGASERCRINSGSSQMRMLYSPTPRTITSPTPGRRASRSWSWSVAKLPRNNASWALFVEVSVMIWRMAVDFFFVTTPCCCTDCWQLRHRRRDAVLDEHLGEIQIRADVERDVQRVTAVRGAGGLHVEHFFDAVDLLFDGQRHRFNQGFGAGAGISGGDLDGRRGDGRILLDRQRVNRHAAQQHDEDGDDVGEHRPLDEEFGEHGRLSRKGQRAGAAGVSSTGVTFAPGLARMRPLTMTRSVGLSPLRMAHRSRATVLLPLRGGRRCRRHPPPARNHPPGRCRWRGWAPPASASGRRAGCAPARTIPGRAPGPRYSAPRASGPFHR